MLDTTTPLARRKPLRLPGYDYSSPIAHFVTVCVAGHRPLLGSVADARVRLTEAGEVVRQEWLYTAIMRADVMIDAFVVMPDHLHGIIVIDDGLPGVRSNVSTIVGGFKPACSVRINQLGDAPVGQLWQRGFHERVIRWGDDLARTRAYIDNNPRRWWTRITPGPARASTPSSAPRPPAP